MSVTPKLAPEQPLIMRVVLCVKVRTLCVQGVQKFPLVCQVPTLDHVSTLFGVHNPESVGSPRSCF